MVPGPRCGPSQSPAFKKELEKLNIIAVKGNPARTGVEQSNDLSLMFRVSTRTTYIRRRISCISYPPMYFFVLTISRLGFHLFYVVLFAQGICAAE